jgi:hypothetical protein
MGFVSGMIGAGIFVGLQIRSNAMMKIPLSRDPWLHVTYGVLGFIVGDWYPKAERRLVLDINEIRADRGLPPLVGSNAWIRYQRPDGEVAPMWNVNKPRIPEEEFPKWRY